MVSATLETEGNRVLQANPLAASLIERFPTELPPTLAFKAIDLRDKLFIPGCSADEVTETLLEHLRPIGQERFDLHSKRNAAVANQVAKLKRFSPENSKALEIAMLWHDAGKVLQPELFGFDGIWTPEQRAERRFHPLTGAIIVEPLLRSYPPKDATENCHKITEIILFHHLYPKEGYPYSSEPPSELALWAQAIDWFDAYLHRPPRNRQAPIELTLEERIAKGIREAKDKNGINDSLTGLIGQILRAQEDNLIELPSR